MLVMQQNSIVVFCYQWLLFFLFSSVVLIITLPMATHVFHVTVVSTL